MKSDFRNWSDLRVFLAVVCAGSTLAASKNLGMAQPTVARRIEALEHALGLVLFERGTRGFKPTPEAQALIGQAQAMENAAKAFADEANKLNVGKSRSIRITAFADAFSGGMPSILDDFIKLHSGVQFEFLSSDNFLDLAAGEADVAIRIARKIDDPSLICRRIRVIGMSLFASNAYAARHPLPSSEAEFAGHKFVVYCGRLAARESQVWVRSRIDPGQIAMEVDDLKAAEGAILMGVGIGICPTRIGQGYDNVIQCFELPPEASSSSWLLVSPAAYRRPEVRAFTAFFVPRFRALYRDS